MHPTHGFTGINRETYSVRDYDTEDNQGWGMWFMHRFECTAAQGKTGVKPVLKSGDLWAGGGTYGPKR